MLFDITVKKTEEDFFNYEKERKEISNMLKSKIKPRIIVLLGPRRVGKTSFMNLITEKYKAAIIDGRNCSNKEEFEKNLVVAISKISEQINEIKGAVRKVKKWSFSFYGLSGEVDIEPEDIEKLNKELGQKNTFAIIAIDEAQEIKWGGFTSWLAHVYDYYNNIILLLSGSQIGLLKKILSKTALKGRAIETIELNRLNKQKSIEFLIKGFDQIGKKVNLMEIEEVAEKLGGLIGWLTYYGYYRINKDHEESMENVLRTGYEIVKEELLSFLYHYKGEKQKVIEVLTAIAKGLRDWQNMKKFVDISDGSLYRILNKLIEYSFIEERNKQYYIIDPVLEHGLKNRNI